MFFGWRWFVVMAVLLLVVGVCVVAPVPTRADDGPGIEVEGLWYGFGYYADADGDGDVNGLDPDMADHVYGTSVMSEVGDVPVDAVVTNIWDFGTGVDSFGQQKVRVVEYDTVSGANVARFFGYSVSGDWSTLHTMTLDVNNSFSFVDETADTVFALSSDEVDDLETVAEVRRLGVYRSPYLDSVLADMADDGIDVSDTSGFEMDGNEEFAYIEYDTGNGTQEAYYRHKPLPQFVDADVLYAETPVVYQGYVKENGAGWENYWTAKTQLRKQQDTSHYGEALRSGAGTGAALAAGAAWWMNLVPGPGQISIAAAAAVGAVVGAAVNIAYHGTKSAYHWLKADNAMSKLDAAVGTEATDDPGIVGLGRPAYGIPNANETVSDPEFLAAGESVFGKDVMVYNYTRPSQQNTYYTAAVNVDDPDAEDYRLVLHATKIQRIPGESSVTVTAYNTAGEEIQQPINLEPSTITQAIDPTEIFFNNETDALQEQIDELLPTNAVIVDQTTIGELTNVVFTQPDITATKVLMLQKTVDKNGVFYLHHIDWQESPAAEFFAAGMNLLQQAYATLTQIVGNEIELTQAALRAWGLAIQHINPADVATEMGYNPQQLTATEYATTALTTLFIQGLPEILGALTEITANWVSYQYSTAHNYATTVFAPTTALATPDNPIPEYDNPNPNPGTQLPTGIAPTPLFQNHLKALTAEDLDTTANAITYNHVTNVDLTPQILEELKTVYDNGDKNTIADKFSFVDLEQDSELTHTVTKYANKLYERNGGDPKYELAPSQLYIRQQLADHTLSNDLHHDGRPFVYTMTIALNDANPTQWVSKNHIGWVQHRRDEITGVKWRLTQEAVNQGITLNEIMTSGQSGQMTIVTGQDAFPSIQAIPHRAPPNSRGRMMALLRFTKVLKNHPGCCTVS